MRFFVGTFVLPLVFTPALFGSSTSTLADAVARALAIILYWPWRPRVSTLQKDSGNRLDWPPNPRLIIQLENNRFWGNPPFSYPQDTATYAFLAQTVETGGKRDRRIDSRGKDPNRRT